jgi:hypothetical protein
VGDPAVPAARRWRLGSLPRRPSTGRNAPQRSRIGWTVNPACRIEFEHTFYYGYPLDAESGYPQKFDSGERLSVAVLMFTTDTGNRPRATEGINHGHGRP